MINDIFSSLKIGSKIKIIAPGSGSDNPQSELASAMQVIKDWGFQPVVDIEKIFGQHTHAFAAANTVDLRLADLLAGITDDEVAALWCFRGGFHTLEILPALAKLPVLKKFKPIIGGSDNSTLFNFLIEKWYWPVVHAPALRQIAQQQVDKHSAAMLKALLQGQLKQMHSSIKPLNKPARRQATIEATLVGGNLKTLQTTLATPWQITADQRFILLEDVDEPPHRINRSLTHFVQAGVFRGAKAIILADFLYQQVNLRIKENDITGVYRSLFEYADQEKIPIVRLQGIGHAQRNTAICLGTQTSLFLQAEAYLVATTQINR